MLKEHKWANHVYIGGGSQGEGIVTAKAPTWRLLEIFERARRSLWRDLTESGRR